MTALTATQYQQLALTWSPQSAQGATATITDPNGGVTVITASSASALPNVWTVYYLVPLSGSYSVAWSTSDGRFTQTDTITVSAWTSTPLMSISDCYLSLSKPVSFLGQDGKSDADMLVYAAAAQRVVENIVGPVTGRVKTETFDGGTMALLLSDRPTTILSILENGQTISDFVVDIASALVRAGTTWYNRPFWPGVQNVNITYLTGGGRVQPNVVLAIREEFRFLWQIGRQGAGADPSQAFDAGMGPGFAVPNRVYELLANERKVPGFA